MDIEYISSKGAKNIRGQLNDRILYLKWEEPDEEEDDEEEGEEVEGE